MYGLSLFEMELRMVKNKKRNYFYILQGGGIVGQKNWVFWF